MRIETMLDALFFADLDAQEKQDWEHRVRSEELDGEYEAAAQMTDRSTTRAGHIHSGIVLRYTCLEAENERLREACRAGLERLIEYANDDAGDLRNRRYQDPHAEIAPTVAQLRAALGEKEND